MILKKSSININKISILIYLFIYSFVCSVLLIFIPILFAIKLKPLDNKFIDLLLPIGRNPFYLPFRSNDSRNYLLGIIFVLLTALIYVILYLITINKKNKKKIYLKFFLFFILFIIINYVAVIVYKIFKTGWSNTVAILKLSYDQVSSIRIYYYPILLIFIGFIVTYISSKIKIIFIFHKFLKRFHFPKLTLPSFFISIFILLIISLLLFNPRYQFSYEKIANYGGEAIHQFHHANFFIAPINEVINGKMLLVNAQAQYGILLTYIPAVILKFTHLSYSNFNLYNIIVSIIYVFIFYLFLVKVTHNRFLSFIATIGFIKLSFFRAFWPYEIYTLPSTIPVRYFFDIIAMYSIYILYNNFSYKKLYFSSFILSLAFFYNTEIGLSIILAYFGIVTINFILHIKDKNMRLRTIHSIVSFLFFC